MSFNGNKNKEENIYGTFYGNQSEDESEEEIQQHFSFAKKKRGKKLKEMTNLNFIKGQTQIVSKINEVKVTKNEKENADADDDEEIMEELLEDYTKQKDGLHLKKDDKNLEQTLSKKYGKGFSILKKAGFKVGSGLGVNEQGITDPIKITKRNKNMGISKVDKENSNGDSADEKTVYKKQDDYFLGKKKKLEEQKLEEGRNEIDEFEQFLEKWSKIKHEIMLDKNPDIDALIPNELIKAQAQSKEINILDYYQLIDKNEQKDFLKFLPKNKQLSIQDLSKLIFKEDNIELNKDKLVNLIKFSKKKVLSYLTNLKRSEDQLITYAYEAESLQNEESILFNKISKNDNFLKDIVEINNFENLKTKTHAEEFDYVNYIQKYINIYERNKEEYHQFDSLTLICLHKVMNRMKFQYSFEDFIKKRKSIILILNKMKILIQKAYSGDYNFDSTDGFKHMFSKRRYEEENETEIKESDKVMGYFLQEIIIGDLINYVINIWNIKEYERLIDIIKYYDEVIPKFLKEFFIESAIIPRLMEYINSNFEIEKETHLWILPWLEVIPLEKIEKVTSLIREKIKNNILSWDVTDLNNIQVLKPWIKLWDEVELTELTNKFILPKLNYLVSKIVVDPKNQNLQNLKILFSWNQLNLVSQESMILILKKHFFPKWLGTLQKWLTEGEFSEEKFHEVQTWYEGWKRYFTKHNLLDSKDIVSEFKSAMMIIIQFSNS